MRTMDHPDDDAAVTRATTRRRVCRTCGQQHAAHEPHVYDYEEEVDEDVTCHICLQPLVTPVDTPCGHTFCKPCLLSFLRIQQMCPVDRKPLTQQLCTVSSLVLKKLLEKLRVRCPNTEHCSLTMARGDLEDHLKYRCPGNWVSCPYIIAGCDYRGAQRTLMNHANACTFRDQGVTRPPIQEGEITHIEIPRTQTALGFTIVGGADTPLRCVVIQEIFPDGLVAQDGRLQPGDQIIEIDGVDMTSCTHHHVCQTLRKTAAVLRLGIYRERIDAYRTTSPNFNNSGETLSVTLSRQCGRQLGIKLGGKRNEPGIFIMEVLEGSVASQDGRLQPQDRILAINGVDVRYVHLDVASRLIQQCQGHISLVVSRGDPEENEYNHLFRQPNPDLPVSHSRTKSAPDRLARIDHPEKKSLSDLVNDCYSNEQCKSASCESLTDGNNQSSCLSKIGGTYSITSLSSPPPGDSYIDGSVGSISVVHSQYQSAGSLGSVGSPLRFSSGNVSLSYQACDDLKESPPALPPRSRQPIGRTQSQDSLDYNLIMEALQDSPQETDRLDTSGLMGRSSLGASVDSPDGGSNSRMRPRRKSRESSDMQELARGIRRSLRIEGTHLQQKTVTISKTPNESLGMRIGGGVSSNEGDTPIYIANINPHGPVGKSKKVKKGDILLSVNGRSLLGLTHSQAVGLLKATAELGGVTLSILEGPETCSGPANFVPSWLYWQKLPRSLHTSRSVVLHRPPGTSLGFSIVGGSDPHRGSEPIHVLFVVSSAPAAVDGKLKCGDRLLSVDGHSLESVPHSAAVSLLKQAGQRVHLEVVSWLGTEL